MSPQRRYCFLVNPMSGGGAASGAVVPVARILRDAGAQVEVIYSPGPQAMHELVGVAVQRGDVVVSVGGDGMLASLVGPMVELRDAGAVLGIVPAGRGNDFARMLEIGGSPAEVAQRLLEATPRQVDVLRAGDRAVAGSIYAGVDADAAAMVARMKRTPKPLQYPIAGLRAISRYVPHRYRLVVDGALHEVEAATVVVANSAYYGSGMKIAPGAALDDGTVQVVVVGAGSRLRLATSFPKIYDGSHVEVPEVQVFTARTVELSAEGRRPVPLGGDGEDLGALPGLDQEPLHIQVLPGALTVL